MNFVVQTPKLM